MFVYHIYICVFCIIYVEGTPHHSAIKWKRLLLALHEFQPAVGSGCCHQQRFASNSFWKCHTCEQTRGREGKPLTLRSCWTSLLRMSCLGFTVSSPFCISFFHKFTWLPCSTPLSSLRFLSKKVALHILDCCAHKRYHISRVIKRKWRGQEMQNTKGSRVQVINFYARGSVTTK